jgi:hypothetical protein
MTSSVGMPVTLAETADRDLARWSSITMTGGKIVHLEEELA